jgi:hypothetical protein
MSALGVPVDINRKAHLTKFQFALGLADALVCKQHPQSAHLKELADSFAHDVLNIATLAGRLLWYEGATPEMWRSHDLIAVGVDAEAYYVMLQSACDIMADVVATLGAKKGQAPWESFHKLNEWALKNPSRLDPAYRLVAANLPWFGEINSTRTAFVHRGKKMLVYTDRLTFNWGRLIPTFRDLTRAMLDFSERLGLVVATEEERQRHPKRRVIDGVYVPSLRHLFSHYKTPKKRSKRLKLAAQCLIACGGYVEAAYIGYPNEFWWKLLISGAQQLASDVVAAVVPVNARGTVHDCKFVLSDGDKTYGLVACDHGTVQPTWLKEAARSVRQLQSKYGAQRAALVVGRMDGSAPPFLPDTEIPLIVGTSSSTVIDKFVAAMQTSLS